MFTYPRRNYSYHDKNSQRLYYFNIIKNIIKKFVSMKIQRKWWTNLKFFFFWNRKKYHNKKFGKNDDKLYVLFHGFLYHHILYQYSCLQWNKNREVKRFYTLLHYYPNFIIIIIIFKHDTFLSKFHDKGIKSHR